MSLIKGTFEITIGAEEASLAEAPLLQRTIAASAVIGWSGFSVHAQVAAMVHGTDIRIGPYLMARLSHGALAAFLTWVLWEPLAGAAAAVETMATTTFPALFEVFPLVVYWGGIAAAFAALTAVMLLISAAVYACRRISVVVIRVR